MATTTTTQFSMLEDTDDTLCHCECCFRCWRTHRSLLSLYPTFILRFILRDPTLINLNKKTIVDGSSVKMPTETAKLDFHRAQVRIHCPLLIILLIVFTQLTKSLSAVAESMRNCAQIADLFAKIVQDSEYSLESADTFHGMALYILQRGASNHSALELEPPTKIKRKVASSPEDGDGSKKRKRATKPKDPNAPKRPASSYILFQNEVRKELKERHPDLSNADLLSLISEQWKSMSEEQKEVSYVQSNPRILLSHSADL